MDLGKAIDELQLGEKASFTKTITETDIVLYAGLTGDFNPLHVNEPYAATTQFGGRIAHGTLPIGLASTVLGTILPGMGTILMGLNVRFREPVRIGDTITCEAEVVEITVDKNIVKFRTTFTNQNGVPVITGEAVARPPGKGEDSLS